LSYSIHPVVAAKIDKMSGSLIVSSHETIEGRKIFNLKGPCIIIPINISDVVIKNNKIGPCGSTVDDVGIRIEDNAHHITVKGNVIHDVASGLYAVRSRNPIIFENNIVYDVRGPMPRGQMIQFDSVTGGNAQSRIIGNISDKQLSAHKTAYEDHINMYQSYGTKVFPILIACNKLRGGDSETGSGIMVGDNGGEWFDVKGNIIVLTTNTGIGVAGASHAIIENNLIWNKGQNRASKTSEAFALFEYAANKPKDIKVINNRGVANSWVGEGDGSLSEGIYDDQSGENILYQGNKWADAALSSAIWNKVLICQ